MPKRRRPDGMSEEEHQEFLRDATTPVQAIDWDAYINGPPIEKKELPLAIRTGAGTMIVPKDSVEPDPLSETWVLDRINRFLPNGRDSFKEEDIERLSRIRGISHRHVVCRLETGKRSESTLQMLLTVFGGYGLIRLGEYDRVYDCVDVKIAINIAEALHDLGIKLIRIPVDEDDAAETD